MSDRVKNRAIGLTIAIVGAILSSVILWTVQDAASLTATTAAIARTTEVAVGRLGDKVERVDDAVGALSVEMSAVAQDRLKFAENVAEIRERLKLLETWKAAEVVNHATLKAAIDQLRSDFDRLIDRPP